MQTLEKTGGDAEYSEKARNSVDHWKGLCLRAFDYSTVSLFQIDRLDLETFYQDEQAEEEDLEMEEMRLKSVLLSRLKPNSITLASS